MKKITIEVTTFELNELYEAIIYKKNQLIEQREKYLKLSKWNNSEKITKVLDKRIFDLDNIHAKIANSENLNSK